LSTKVPVALKIFSKLVLPGFMTNDRGMAGNLVQTRLTFANRTLPEIFRADFD